MVEGSMERVLHHSTKRGGSTLDVHEETRESPALAAHVGDRASPFSELGPSNVMHNGAAVELASSSFVCRGGALRTLLICDSPTPPSVASFLRAWKASIAHGTAMFDEATRQCMI